MKPEETLEPGFTNSEAKAMVVTQNLVATLRPRLLIQCVRIFLHTFKFRTQMPQNHIHIKILLEANNNPFPEMKSVETITRL